MTDPEQDAGFTVDTLLRGRVTLLQPTRGYRTGLDPLLLAAFVTPPFGRFLDIGCGTGALSFLLLAGDAQATGVAVELQPALAALARDGRARNGWEQRLRLVAGDVRVETPEVGASAFDLVITNPPFYAVNKSRPSPHEGRALANHEVALTLPQWLDAAARAVRPGGRVAAIFPAGRQPELLGGLRERHLCPTRLRPVHPRAEAPPIRVLVEAVKDRPRPLITEPPLILHADGPDTFTPEVRRMLGA